MGAFRKTKKIEKPVDKWSHDKHTNSDRRPIANR